MFSVELKNLDWNAFSGPATLEVSIPEKSGFSKTISGTLHLSNKGYVYSLSSKPVIWLKFLGLMTYLSISGTTTKCKHVGYKIFQKPINQKEIQDLKHIFRLAAIAGKGVIGKGKISLAERVEQFAFAELKYNNTNQKEEMKLPRSIRLKRGTYVAKCMQPLFHTSQAPSSKGLEKAIKDLKEERIGLIKEKKERPNRDFSKFVINLFSNKTYMHLSMEQIEERLISIETLLPQKAELLKKAKDWQRYAKIAILNQQGLSTTFNKLFVDMEEEVKCCEDKLVLFRHKRICGLIHEIECCALKCLAVNCGYCYCVTGPCVGC